MEDDDNQLDVMMAQVPIACFATLSSHLRPHLLHSKAFMDAKYAIICCDDSVKASLTVIEPHSWTSSCRRAVAASELSQQLLCRARHVRMQRRVLDMTLSTLALV